MRKGILGLALAVPLAALAHPHGPGGGGGGPPDDAAMRERMAKRMRLARTIGLAEALDLDETQALKLRDVMGKFDEKRAPLREQARSSNEVLRKAAGGDAAAQKGVDDALKKLREARTKLAALHDEMFQAITKDLNAEKKARAALFLRRFHQGMAHRMRGHGGGRGPGMGPGMGPRMQGPGGGPGSRFGMWDGPGGGDPDLEFVPDDEQM